jgi:hypothetical protein
MFLISISIFKNLKNLKNLKKMMTGRAPEVILKFIF